jgi:hypothetical protein
MTQRTKLVTREVITVAVPKNTFLIGEVDLTRQILKSTKPNEPLTVKRKMNSRIIYRLYDLFGTCEGKYFTERLL